MVYLLLSSLPLCSHLLRGRLRRPALPRSSSTLRSQTSRPASIPRRLQRSRRIYYRTGSDKLRIEEAIDAANGIHGVIVVAEPNIWMANLYDGTGKHIVDPGPTFFAKAPVFGTSLSGKLIGLEFGCEADFIAANAPKPVRVEQVGGIGFDVYRIEDGPDAVEILEKSGTNIPAFARYFHQGNLVAVLRYDLYRTNLPSDPSLFVAPPNVRYTQATSS